MMHHGMTLHISILPLLASGALLVLVLSVLLEKLAVGREPAKRKRRLAADLADAPDIQQYVDVEAGELYDILPDEKPKRTHLE